mmetsp:Transcript_28481/g.58696  ORF Transcript_28481/g.58696 Transcript_28481/m.58696 type:complete len:692 (+) Transcript_28481:60-2135(+)
MTRPSRLLPRQKRWTRLLIFCGLFWAVSCWFWIIFVFSTTTSILFHPSSGLHSSQSRLSSVPSTRKDNNKFGTDGYSVDREDIKPRTDLRGAKPVTENIESPPLTIITTPIVGKNNDDHDNGQHSNSNENNQDEINNSRPHFLDEEPNAPTPPPPPPQTSFTYPLHAKSGTHHAYLYIGTPPQRQTVIVDTGSRLTAFPCAPHCTDCGSHASPIFQLEESSTREILSCGECVLAERVSALERYFEGDGTGGTSGDGPGGGPSSGFLRGSAALGSASDSDNGKSENDRKKNWDNGSYEGFFAQQNNDRDGADSVSSSPEWMKERVVPETCVNNQCEISQRYTEGSSWKAFEVRDKVWLGSNSQEDSLLEHEAQATPFVFGCQISEKGLFRDQYADGIMGLSLYPHTIIGALKKNGSIGNQSFSLCFNKKGGHMSLGGIGSQLFNQEDSVSSPPEEQSSTNHSSDHHHDLHHHHHIKLGKHLSPMKFVPLTRRDVTHYSVTVTGLSIGHHALPSQILKYLNDHKGTIIDSGTTDSFLSHKISNAFHLAWEKTTGKKYHNRVQHLTYEQFARLPVIRFELEGGISWSVRPEAYMELQESSLSNGRRSRRREEDANLEKGGVVEKEIVQGPVLVDEDILDFPYYERWNGTYSFVSRIYVDEPHGAVLGSNVMMDHDVYFDVDNKRIGVARSICAY